MNLSISAKETGSICFVGRAVHPGHTAARLFNDDPSGCCIPGIQSVLPEAVHPSTRNAAHVDGGGAQSPDALRLLEKLTPPGKIFIHSFADVVGETCNHEGPFELIDIGDP